MRLGPVEGTSDEIKGFIQDNGLEVEKFFQTHEEPIGTIWFVLPAAIVVCSLATLTLMPLIAPSLKTFVFLVGCVGALWLSANIQLRFKNIWAAIGVLVGCVLFLLVALGVLLPSDLPGEARKWKG